MVVVGLMLVVCFGRSVTHRDHSPFGKNEQQVDRLYGEPIKVDGTTRTYLLGDIIADVDFIHYEGKSRATHVTFYKDSPVPIISNRITMQEAQRLMREVSGGGQWKFEQDDSRYGRLALKYIYREKSLRIIYRRLRYDTHKELRAFYVEDFGSLGVTDLSSLVSFGGAFDAEPPSKPVSSSTADKTSYEDQEFDEVLGALSVKARDKARKQSQGRRILNDARQMDAAIDQWALEKGKKDGDTVVTSEAATYLKGKWKDTDLLGNTYVISAVGFNQIKIATTTKSSLDGVGIDWGQF